MQHRVDLIRFIYPGNPAVDLRRHLFAANLRAHGYPPDMAQHGALAMIEGIVMRQATALAYNDSWRLILISFVMSSPAILLLRRPREGARPAGGAH